MRPRPLFLKLPRQGHVRLARELTREPHRFIHVQRETRGLPLQALVDARAAIEPMVAQLAAMHRTEDDLAALRRVADRLDDAVEADVRRFLKENVKWHHALAAASHNDLLRAFASSISKLMYDASRIRNFASADVRIVVSKSHRRVLAAIEQRDPDAARRRTERDIQSYARYLAAALKSSADGRHSIVKLPKRSGA